MKKIVALMLGLFFLAGCAPKTGPLGPMGPQGEPGTQGPEGPGYSEVTLQPGPGDDSSGKDNLIGPATGNNGGSTTIGFGYSTAISNTYRTLIYFDVTQAGLPAGATIVDAILTLYPSSGSTAGNLLTAHLYPITKTWTESASTWTAATSTTNWASAGGDFIDTASIGAFTVDVSTTSKIDIHLDVSYVQNWVNGQVNYGFIVKSDKESSPDANLAVYSRDYSIDTSKRPALKLIYK